MRTLDDSWKWYFDDVILHRGYDYFRSGAVSGAEVTEDGYSAVVSGTRDYTVNVIIDDGHFADAECDCPYSEAGNYCKHEAALLYYISENHLSLRSGKGECSRSEIGKLIDGLDENTLRKILLELAVSDRDIRTMLYTGYSEGVPDQLVKDMKARVRRIAACLDPEEYDYRGGAAIIQKRIIELSVIADEKVRPLLEKNDFFKVFCLAADIVESIPSAELDDCGYDAIDDVIWDFEDIMREACGRADLSVREAIRDEVRKRMAGSSREFYRDFLITVLHDRDAAKQRLDEIRNSPDSRTSSVLEEITLMEILGYDEAEIISRLESRSENKHVREALVMRLWKHGKWKECLSLIDSFQQRFGYDRECSGIMKNIYREHGMRRELAESLTEELMTVTQGSLNDVRELHDLVSPEEWNEICGRLKHANTMTLIMAPFLDYIGDDDSLMDWLESPMCPPHYLQEYGERLAERFPGRVVARYEAIADSIAKRMHDRSGYAAYAGWLKRMTVMERGRRRALQKAAEMRKNHPRHRALHDELAEAGL